MRASHITTVFILAAATATVSGCSADSAPDGDKTSPTASASPRPTDIRTANPTAKPTLPALEKTEVRCEDGSAIVEDVNNKDVTVPDCARVTINTSNAVIHLGATEELTVNGAINGIDAPSIGSVTITGDGNRVTTKSKPEIDDQGSSNTVQH